MSVTLQELERFTHFAQQKLGTSESTLSLEDCVRLWRQQTERDATLDDIQQGRLDLEAGFGSYLIILETRKWQDQSGADRYSTEVVLRNFNSTLTLLDGREGGGGSGGYEDRGSYEDNAGGRSGGAAGSSQGGGSGSRSDMDDEIPF